MQINNMTVKTFDEMFGRPLTVRDLVEEFDEDTKTGRVRAYGGRLNVRPAYQREFIYETKAQQAVIDTVMNGFPLNVMYWAKSDAGSDTEYEVMDGQQRILSICKFHDVQQVWPVMENGRVVNKNFDEFNSEQVRKFLNYPLLVYICDGDEKDKMQWFRTINRAGIKLTEQEMRNAVYSSPWVTSAKRYFSNPKGEGYASEGILSNGHIYGDYVDVILGRRQQKDDISINEKTEKNNSLERQALLEIALSWAVQKYNHDNNLNGKDAIDIDEYMRINKNKPDASELFEHYACILEWVKERFYYDPLMKLLLLP